MIRKDIKEIEDYLKENFYKEKSLLIKDNHAGVCYFRNLGDDRFTVEINIDYKDLIVSIELIDNEKGSLSKLSYIDILSDFYKEFNNVHRRISSLMGWC